MISDGTVLKGKYRIVSLIKSGGMGYVYEGKYNGNKCIIKEPKTGEGINESDYFLEKIKIEAKILSKIKHDNIVGYIDSFEEYDSFFLVEKYVEGDKLEDKYLNNPGSEDEVISYTLQLLNAVGYLHKKQIKHRDINPNNLILTPDQKLVLIDFGTAKYFNTEQKEIKSIPKSTKVGTPYYAPPEQWEGDTSPASDIFSIGRTMYFMLTGEHPTENPYRRLDFLGKNVRKELADFVIKAAEPEEKDRYESVVQMIYLLNKGKRISGAAGVKKKKHITGRKWKLELLKHPKDILLIIPVLGLFLLLYSFITAYNLISINLGAITDFPGDVVVRFIFLMFMIGIGGYMIEKGATLTDKSKIVGLILAPIGLFMLIFLFIIVNSFVNVADVSSDVDSEYFLKTFFLFGMAMIGGYLTDKGIKLISRPKISGSVIFLTGVVMLLFSFIIANKFINGEFMTDEYLAMRIIFFIFMIGIGGYLTGRGASEICKN